MVLSEIVGKIKSSNTNRGKSSIIRNLSDQDKSVLINHFNTENLSEICYMILNNISNIPKCICEKSRKFHKMNKGYFVTCGDSECKKKVKMANYEETCLKKYGSKQFLSSNIAKEKIKKSNLEKYGVEQNLSSTIVRNKIKTTMKEKYGSEHPLQNKKILKKRLNTCLENNGTLNMFGLETTKNTIKEKYGVDNVMKNDDIKNQVSLTQSNNKLDILKEKLKNFDIEIINSNKKYYLDLHCTKCNNKNSTLLRQFINWKIRNNESPCQTCNPHYTKISYRSKKETELATWISSEIDDELLLNRKSIIKNRELDIYIPDKKIAIEFNGIYWHSDLYKDPKYHIDKKFKCNDIGVNLIHIWEDDWDYNKEIVKSRLRIAINSKNINRIYARKCQIKFISNSEANEFLDQTHLQGKSVHKHSIGLYYNDELVGVMTLGKTRKFIHGNTNSLEVLRMSFKLNTQIIGGSSKMLKFAIDNIKFDKLYSYADLSYSSINNCNYSKIGFKLDKITDPGYSWLINGMRSNRLNWTKQKLVDMGFDSSKTADDIMRHDLKAYKIYDSGNLKFVLENKPSNI